MITHGSLFSGIGGFDLAADWCGWENKFHCEWNPFGQKVLKHYWPNSETYEDITKTDFTIWRGRITVLSGGFPCQPYSSAGKRLGKEDDRHLWPEMLRAIREISPSYVVGENVLGLTNWNGGLVFEEVCADLEAEGYKVQPFILPAASVNAPHKRDRVWFIAHSNRSNDGRTPGQDASEKGEKRVQERNAIRKPIESSEVFGSVADTYNARTNKPVRNKREWTQINEERGRQSQFELGEVSRDASNTPNNGLEHGTKSRGLSESKGETWGGTRGQSKAKGEISDAADTKSQRSGKLSNEARKARPRKGNILSGGESGIFNASNTNSRRQSSKEHGQAETRRTTKASFSNDWQNFPTQPPICGGDDGLSRELDGITFPKWRNESIKAYGNAIVPQVAYEIFKVIEELEAGS